MFRFNNYKETRGILTAASILTLLETVLAILFVNLFDLEL